MLSFFIVWLSKLSVLSLQALCRLPGASVSTGDLSILSPTGLASSLKRSHCLACCALHLFKSSLLIWPHSKPKNRDGCLSTDNISGSLHPMGWIICILFQLWLWKSSIAELSPRKKRASSYRLTLWAVNLTHFPPLFLNKSIFVHWDLCDLCSCSFWKEEE